MMQQRGRRKTLLLLGGTTPDVLRHVLSLAEGLRRAGDSVLIVGPLDRDVRVRLNDLGFSWVNLAVPAGLQLRAIRKVSRALAELLAKEKPDVIHCHGYRAAALIARARSASPGSALICTAHAIAVVPPRPRLEALVRRYVFSHLPDWMDRIICVSNAVLDSLVRVSPRAETKCQTVYNGIDPRSCEVDVDPGVKKIQLGIDPMAAGVGVIAPLTPDKGVDVFLEAGAKLLEGIGNIDFVIVGNGPERERLAEQAHQLRLTGSVVFLEGRSDVPEILATLDVAVIPSREEAFSYVALEAVAVGTPLVSTTAGALAEILGDVEGVQLVQPEDPIAMADAIFSALNEMPDDEEMTPFSASAVEALSGELSSSVDITLRKDEYDLDEHDLERRRPDEEPSGRASARQTLQERFSLTRFIEETQAVYAEALAERAAD